MLQDKGRCRSENTFVMMMLVCDNSSTVRIEDHIVLVMTFTRD